MNRLRMAVGLLLALPMVAMAMTADELIAKNIEARGGRAALEALSAVSFTGRLQAGGFEADVRVLKSKGRLRNEFSIQGMTQIQAFDGKEGWAVSPFQGRKDPQKLSEDNIRNMPIDADIAGPLLDYAGKGHRVEYLGTEDVDGTAAHKLRVSYSNGNEATYFLDPDYFLEIRVITKLKIRGSEFENETDLGDYEKINGVFFPFSVASGAKGSSQKSTVTYEKGEGNPTLADTLFTFPEGK